MSTPDSKSPSHLASDRPIKGRDDDRFKRRKFAEALARQIAGMPLGESYVFGLIGPWGTGKTSVLNMIEETLLDVDKITTIRFNPWLFSNTEQLIARFFGEIAAQLREKSDERFKKIGEALERYGTLVSPLQRIPVVGSVVKEVADAGKALGSIMRELGGAAETSIDGQRKRLEEMLKAADKQLLVMIDDVDRLRDEEIRDVMRLVRLAADLPNIIYLLAFDRQRVEQSLSASGGDGRAYLEKIVQFVYEVPPAQMADLHKLLIEGLNQVIESYPHGPFYEKDWQNIFALGLRYLFGTARDVRRYVASLPATLQVIGEEIAVVDVLALEAIRILLPDVFQRMVQHRELLTQVPDRSWGMMGTNGREKQGEEREAVKSIFDAAGAKSDAVQEICKRLFPASRRLIDNYHFGHESRSKWRRKRRVAHSDVFEFYLEKQLADGSLAAHEVQSVFDSLGDETRLRALLEKLDPEQLEHMLGRLEDYETEFKPASVEAAVKVFLLQGPRLREGRKGMLDFGADLAMSRLVLRLLRRVKKMSNRCAVVEKVLGSDVPLSGKFDLVKMVGYIKGVGHKLVSADDASRLASSLREQIQLADAKVLASERDLLRLVGWAFGEGGDVRPERLSEFTTVGLWLWGLCAGSDRAWRWPDGGGASGSSAG